MTVFSMCIFLNPLNAKADYNQTMHVIDATDTTLTIDWSMAAQDCLAEFKAEGYKNVKFTKLTLQYAKSPCDMNKVINGGGKALKTSARQCTIKNLKPGTDYFISVSYDYTCTKNGSPVSGGHNFQLNSAVTTNGHSKTAKLVGVTGTTATVNFGDAVEEIREAYKAEGLNPSFDDLYVGYADQEMGMEAALKKAKEIAGKQYYPLAQEQKVYTMRGLTPGHTYTVVAAAGFDDFEKDKAIFEYITLTDVKTAEVDDSDIYNYVPPQTSYDSRTDQAAEGRWFKNVNDPIKINVVFTTEAGKDSITIDWSKQKYKSLKIKPVGKEKKIYLACVKEEQYDRYADNLENGPVDNYGPNIRKAGKLVDAKEIGVDPKETSYTFTGLDPASSYVVMMRCSYKDGNTTCKKIYPYASRVLTEGGLTYDDVEKQVNKNKKDAYLYDGKVRRDGSLAHLDWTNALHEFYGQDALRPYFAQLKTNKCCWIGYAKLPESYTQNDVMNSYREALNQADYWDHFSLAANYPYTNTVVHRLDPSAKYVFAVKFYTSWYDLGWENNFDDVLFIDETGTNFLKAKATNSQYDGHPIDWRPGDEGGSGSSDEGGSGSSDEGGSGSSDEGGSGSSDEGGSGSSDEGGSGSSDEGGSGSSDEGGSGSSDEGGSANSGESSQEGGNGPRVDTETPAENSNNSSNAAGNTADSQMKGAGDQALISCGTGKISYKKLKKNSKTVKIKVENSEGKITVKDISSRKNKNIAKIKIKGRNITVKFKKGTPKGTYKFMVTVAASGNIKKTTETIKIKVK